MERKPKRTQAYRLDKGRKLLEMKATKLQRQVVADFEGVTERTVRNWMTMTAKEDAPVMGCPPHSKRKRFAVMRVVWPVFLALGGEMGWRQAREALPDHDAHPTRQIQWAVKRIKRILSTRHREHLKKNRISMEIKASGAIMAQDGTHVGRTEDAAAVEAQVAIDAATREVKGMDVGFPATQEAILAFWQGLPDADRPLVWQTDNALAYLAGSVQAFLIKIGVIHMVSQPGKPTDNPRAERFMKSFKGVSGLGKGVIIRSMAGVALHAARCADWMTRKLKMTSRSMQTASQLAMSMSPWYHFVDRWTFYNQTRARLDSLTQEPRSLKERRKLERSIIMGQLVRYGLAEVTRGGAYYAL